MISRAFLDLVDRVAAAAEARAIEERRAVDEAFRSSACLMISPAEIKRSLVGRELPAATGFRALVDSLDVDELQRIVALARSGRDARPFGEHLTRLRSESDRGTLAGLVRAPAVLSRYLRRGVTRLRSERDGAPVGRIAPGAGVARAVNHTTKEDTCLT